MADLKAVAHVVRWASESMALNLDALPEDKLNWKPDPASKSAMQVVAEATGVMRMMLPLFSGGEFEMLPYDPAPTREEAKSRLAEAAAAFATALDAAGPELQRAIPSPFGTDLWVEYSVLFGMIDLVHHHGQITYIQSLCGDAENHGTREMLQRWFAPPAAGA